MTAATQGHTHTPGPWHVGERPQPRSMLPIRAADGKVVAYVPNGGDAPLIASTPELLGLLYMARDFLSHWDDKQNPLHAEIVNAALEQIRSTLAKVEACEP